MKGVEFLKIMLWIREEKPALDFDLSINTGFDENMTPQVRAVIHAMGEELVREISKEAQRQAGLDHIETVEDMHWSRDEEPITDIVELLPEKKYRHYS